MKSISNEQMVKKMLCKQCTCLNVCRKEKYETPCEKYKGVLRMAVMKDEQSERKQDIAIGCLFSFFKSQGNTDEQINNFIAAIETQIEKK